MTAADRDGAVPPMLVAALETTTPDHLRTGPDADPLRLVLSTPDTDVLVCHRVELHLPVGTGPQHLVADPARLRLHTSADGWRVEHTGDDVFALSPPQPTEIVPGAPLELALDGVGVDTEPGTASIGVRLHGEHAGRPEDFGPFRYRLRTGNTPLIEYFRPDKLTVDNGKSTTLHWKGPKKDVKPYPTYWLYVGANAGEDVTKYMDADGKGSWDTGPLTTATSYGLVADTGSNDPPTATIAVTVNKPDLEVGRLSATGQIKLLTNPQALCDQPFEYQKAWGKSYTAATDGLLAANAHPLKDGTATITAIVYDDDREVGQCYSVIGTKDAPGNLLFPVPNGYTLDINANANGKPFHYQATWYPLGTGGLS
ncbi:hypothetical protein [Saccharopolyspora spinosa]|uniref:Uncharacterized protein n=1 Tax=Saccharopolyspora spinosa TaxID=60894 RepID=A0A2N3Y6Q1_SACSN|nr:hypothetical protein [Saccharopolyspora spinosa]PKW18545.1 hypothetical protein A8926_6640 [Saccharopolyspora spinosa]